MKLCDNGHPEIVHDCFRCPLCEANEQRDNLTKRIAEFNEQIVEVIEQIEREAKP